MTPSEFQALRTATPAQMADLETLVEQLTEANAVMNLVGPDSLPDVWNRHIFDSAQLLDLVPNAKTWADLGAGAGFPGLVLAILLKDRADSHVWLIDSLGKRCRFLQAAVGIHQASAYNAGAGLGVEARGERINRAGQHADVAVEKQDMGTTPEGGAGVAGFEVAHIFRVPDDGCAIDPVEHRTGAVGRGIVDDDQFEGCRRSGPYRSQGDVTQFGLIVEWYDDRHFRRSTGWKR